MNFVDSLLHRNAEFAKNSFNPSLKMLPTSKSIIVGCVDPRVDPMNIFGLDPGEAAIYRNVGGRVGPALIETVGLLKVVSQAAGGKIGPESNLVILHHTDCGINHCYHQAPDLLARHMEVKVEELDDLAVTDPYRSVSVNVAALRALPNLAAYTISGLVYDVATGKIETVVPANSSSQTQ